MSVPTCVLFDLNNMAFRTVYSMDSVKRGGNPNYDLWHYAMFNAIQSFIESVEGVSEVVLAIDANLNWRKMIYTPYKADRAGKRAKQQERNKAAGKVEFNMSEFMRQYALFIQNIKKHLPFYVLQQEYAEADDIIGVLALRNHQEGRCRTIVVSADEDYQQLYRTDGNPCKTVLIYDPLKRKYRSCANTEYFLAERFLTGQGKDNIYNCLTPTRWEQMSENKGARKPSMGAKTAEKILYEGLIPSMDKKARVGCKVVDGVKRPNFYRGWVKRFRRNRRLIDLRMVPEPLSNAIRTLRDSYQLPPLEQIEPYFQQHNWVSVIPRLSKLQEMYKGLHRA